MTSRRDFFKSASLLALGGLVAGKTDFATANNQAAQNILASKNIGLQIYSLGDELFKDVPGGLKRLKQMGYRTLELAGYNNGKIRDISMPDFKKMCDDAGLKITSSHLNPPVREYTQQNRQQIADFWKKAADEHAAIDVKYIIQPGQPSTRSIEEVAQVSEVFNEAGKIAKAVGLSFGYHNHEREFSSVIAGGTEMKFGRGAFRKDDNAKIVYDEMMKNTDPSLVFFELDVYWCVMGQQDPVEYMKKYPDRITFLHIKDKSVLGQSGMMNFEMIYKQAYANGIKHFFVELEGIGPGKQFEGVKGCADYLLKAKFVK